jgi:hypothetical protein
MQGMLYRVPHNANDDWYWMAATVTEPAIAVPGAAVQERVTSVAVTNDLTRDHAWQLLPERQQWRWRTQQMVDYSLSHAYAPDSARSSGYPPGLPVATVNAPPLYSREVHAPGARAGDGSWHFPLAEDDAVGNPEETEERWLCVTPVSK